jgi:hypothetical protein
MRRLGNRFDDSFQLVPGLSDFRGTLDGNSIALLFSLVVTPTVYAMLHNDDVRATD